MCNAQAVYDPFSDYLQRSDSIAPWAGNAVDANAAIQTITPWPPYVEDTRIPIEGRQGVNAVEQMYRAPEPFGHEGVEVGVSRGPGAGETSGSAASLGASAPRP
jgi:hypothetical protein